MGKLNKRDRMRILELSVEIATEASRNPNVVFMIEFQEMLIEATYRKMVALLEADLEAPQDAADQDEADDRDPQDGDPPASVWRHEAREQAASATAVSAVPVTAPARRVRIRKSTRD